jgi:predicted MFS family arabinose efflux permease
MHRIFGLTFLFYFIQTYVSNPGISSLALSIYLKETLNLSAREFANFGTIAFLPWMIKPVFGAIADSFPLFGYKFKSYFVACYGLVIGLLLFLAALKSYPLTVITVVALLISTCIAFSDVLADKLMIEVGKPSGKTGQLQSLQWTGLGLGGVITSYLGGQIAQHQNLSFAFLVSAILPLAGIMAVLVWMPERTVKSGTISIRKSFHALFKALRSPSFLAIAGFVFLLGTTPLPPLLYYQRDVLKFSEEFLGILGAFGFFGVGLGALIFGIWFRKFQQNMLLKLAVVTSILSALALAFIVDKNSAIIVQVFTNCTTIISFLSLSEVFVRSCPEMIEGTFYACFVSVVNLAAMLGSIIGGWLYDLNFAFPSLAIAASLYSVLGWFFIPLVNRKIVGDQ